MARQKKLSRYPDRYWTLIEKAWKTPFFIPCEDPLRARSMRNDLYNFRKALRIEAEKSDRLAMIYSKASDLVFSVVPAKKEEDGPRLMIYRRHSVNEIPSETIYHD